METEQQKQQKQQKKADIAHMADQDPKARAAWRAASSAATEGEAESAAAAYLESRGVPPRQAASAAKGIAAKARDPLFAEGFADLSPSGPRILLAATEIPLVEPAAKGLPLPQARLLMALLAIRSESPHPSGRIRYQRRAAMHLAGLSRRPEREREEAAQGLRAAGWLALSVAGSKQPVPTFRLVPLPPEPEGRMLDMGPMTPKGIDGALEALGREI